MNRREIIDLAAKDWRNAPPAMVEAVTDGLAKDLAKTPHPELFCAGASKHGNCCSRADDEAKDLAKPRRATIKSTRLERKIICETSIPKHCVVLEVVANHGDGGILEAVDPTGETWACAMTVEGLQQQLFGMTLPE